MNEGRQRHGSTAQSDAAGNNTRIDDYFGKDKGAGMRISYAGTGYPFTFVM
jgi:cell cycle checkpoint protein